MFEWAKAAEAPLCARHALPQRKWHGTPIFWKLSNILPTRFVVCLKTPCHSGRWDPRNYYYVLCTKTPFTTRRAWNGIAALPVPYITKSILTGKKITSACTFTSSWRASRGMGFQTIQTRSVNNENSMHISWWGWHNKEKHIDGKRAIGFCSNMKKMRIFGAKPRIFWARCTPLPFKQVKWELAHLVQDTFEWVQ